VGGVTNDTRTWGLFVLLSVIWGSSYLFISGVVLVNVDFGRRSTRVPSGKGSTL
jgi:hypothetical protein